MIIQTIKSYADFQEENKLKWNKPWFKIIINLFLRLYYTTISKVFAENEFILLRIEKLKISRYP